MAKAMNPGRELDALVAEKVMGWTMAPAEFGPSRAWLQCWHKDGKPILTIHMFKPSTDIAAAWEVVEKLAARMEFDVGTGLIDGDTRGWICGFQFRDFTGNALTAPHAICLAALKAVGVEL